VEDDLKPLTPNGASLSLTFRPWQVRTLRIKTGDRPLSG
jgi:hypothetical protein